MCVAQKTQEDSMYSAVDAILMKYNIKRSAYHSGQINGVGIKRLMDNAESIMDEIKNLMLSRRQQDCVKTVEDITTFCTDARLFFGLWDNAFAAVHNPDPDLADCDGAQRTICLVMAQIRQMGMSITPKAHGMEDHVVNQMRHTRGGVSRMIEHWVERYHQVGYRYDTQWRLLKNEHFKAGIRSHREHIASHPQVRKRVNLLVKMCSKCPRERTIDKMASQREIKKQRRQESVQEATALHVVPSTRTEDDTTVAEILADFSAREREEDAKLLMEIRGQRSV